MNIDEICQTMAEFLNKYKMENIAIFETDKKTKISKRIIACSCDNEAVAKSVAGSFIENFKNTIMLYHKDGIIKGEWIVLDYDDINVHIFTKNVREKYSIDKLWQDYAVCKNIN